MTRTKSNSSLVVRSAANVMLVTGFVAMSTYGALAAQVVQSLDQDLVPTSYNSQANQVISIADESLLKLIGTNKLSIDSNNTLRKYTTNEKIFIPDGYYKLDQNKVIRVQNGQVTHQSSSIAMGSAHPSDGGTSPQVKWKLIVPRFKSSDAITQLAINTIPKDTQTVSVKDVLSNIINS